jgi:polysaccharide deacetylase family protein (PEP-CTERM system associated)
VTGPSNPILNALTVDVEEYFHATEVQNATKAQSWDSFPSRVELQVERTLELLESKRARATFLILGWVAQRYPQVVRRIVDSGHEIGCHSHLHRLVYDLTPAEFREDTLRAVRAIEDACGITPRIYRAPSYSITRRSLWALEILVECGFTQDSSIYPISHDRYGIPGSRRQPHWLNTPSGPIFEVPIATVALANGHVLPVGGGGYLRLLPYRYCAAGIRRLNENDRSPACIYFHPWEIDPQQPHLSLGLVARIRTYAGLAGMKAKLARLLDEFHFARMSDIYTHYEAESGPPTTQKPLQTANGD